MATRAKTKGIGRHAVVSKIVDEKIDQTLGKVTLFDKEPAVVRVSMGTTLNMGNYQSLRLGVDLSLPCEPAAVEVVFGEAVKFVKKKLDLLVTEHAPAVGPQSIEEVEL